VQLLVASDELLVAPFAVASNQQLATSNYRYELDEFDSYLLYFDLHVDTGRKIQLRQRVNRLCA
jgi:hypothetical protein